MNQAAFASAAAIVLLLTGCGDGKKPRLDPATLERGSFRSPRASEAPPPLSMETLPSGADVYATPAAQSVQAYLSSDEPAGRSFPLPFIGFVQGGEVREDPNGSIASLVAVLRADPQTRIRLEVLHANPQQGQVSEWSEDRAARLADAFVRNGMPPDRVSSAGVRATRSQVPRARLVVVAK